MTNVCKRTRLKSVLVNTSEDETLKKWHLMCSEKVYASEYFTLLNDTVILPDKSIMEYKRVELRDFCSTLPLAKNRKIVMVDIYRYPANSMSLEIPSGFVEHEENPRAAAFRELEEETGYKSSKLTSWGWFYPWTRSTQKAHVFLAENLTKGHQTRDHAEQIEVKLLTIKEAKKMLIAGKITHAPTIIALQKLVLKTRKISICAPSDRSSTFQRWSR